MLFAILAGISAVLEVASTVSQMAAAEAAANAQREAVKAQTLQSETKLAHQKTKEADLAIKYLDHNTMVAVNRGESLQSPSFNAIQQTTLIHAQQALQSDKKAEKSTALSEKSRLSSIDEQEDYQETALFFHGLMSVASIGASYAAMSGGLSMSGRGGFYEL